MPITAGWMKWDFSIKHPCIVLSHNRILRHGPVFWRDCELIPGYLYCFLATSEYWGLTLAESTGLALGLSTEPKYLTEIGEKKFGVRKTTHKVT